MNDIHEQSYPDLNIMAGIKDLKITLQSPLYTLLVNTDIAIPLGSKRGVHMSRLIFPELIKLDSIEAFIDLIKVEVHKKTDDFPEIVASFQFPWKDQFPQIIVENYISTKNYYTFTLQGITACPCSKEHCGVGHMQKCTLITEVFPVNYPKFESILTSMEKCFSATLNEKLKREQEAAKITEAQTNAKFVEDVVRKAVELIPDLQKVTVISDESIHSHKAVAIWKKI